MSKPIYNLTLRGGLGNCMFQYAHARKLAELEGAELRTTEWLGQGVFEGVDERAPVFGEGIDLSLDYRQTQADLIYTRRDCRRWFKWDTGLESSLHSIVPHARNVAHLRRGDYKDAGFVLVSRCSYERVFKPLYWVSAERGNGTIHDFFQMTRAERIYRANSTFSWWAATLSHARVFSPIIEGLQGGQEHDCDFVEGNWPRFITLPNVTDLFLRE